MLKYSTIQIIVLEITIEDTLTTEDFDNLAPEADELIKQHGTIRLLINASNLHGWKNLEAAERHIAFVKGHHKKVERLAIVADHLWQ